MLVASGDLKREEVELISRSTSCVIEKSNFGRSCDCVMCLCGRFNKLSG